MTEFILSPLFANFKPLRSRGRIALSGPAPLIGQKFHHLLAVAHCGGYRSNNRRSLYLCLCDCGNFIKVTSTHLSIGHSKSCGCKKSDFISARFITHGWTTIRDGKKRDREYGIWSAMINRCTDSKNKAWLNYGGRGIKVHPDLRTFEGFISHMGKSNGLTLERFDVNDDYAPGNVGWVTTTTQSRNKRNNVFVVYNGEKLILKDAIIKSGKSISQYRKYLKTCKSCQEAFDMAGPPKIKRR
jgi:hypothetical protein